MSAFFLAADNSVNLGILGWSTVLCFQLDYSEGGHLSQVVAHGGPTVLIFISEFSEACSREETAKSRVFIFRKLVLSLGKKFVGSDTTVNIFTRDWQEGR